MKKFVVIYYAPVSANEKMKNASPEEIEKGMAPWMIWAKKVGSGMVALGTPLGNGQKITKTRHSSSDKNIAGYSVLQAENMQKAIELVNGHPHLDWDAACEIEIYESLPMPI